jgi:hypothetical protein
MTATALQREILPDGSVVLRDARCSFRFVRDGSVMEIVIEGVDRGQLGDAPLDEIALALVREGPLELFVDATRASMPTVEVSRQWTRFFSLNRERLKRVSILVGSRPVELTVAIAQHLSQTGNLIQIYSDEAIYSARKAEALRTAGRR